MIGTLDAEEFAAVQSEIEKLAWSAFSLRNPNVALSRANVTMRTLHMTCEIDHVARRVTVLALSRQQGGVNRVVIDDEPAPRLVSDGDSGAGESKASGGGGKKR